MSLSDGSMSAADVAAAYSHLEQAMRSARNEKEREAIRQAMSSFYM